MTPHFSFGAMNFESWFPEEVAREIEEAGEERDDLIAVLDVWNKLHHTYLVTRCPANSDIGFVEFLSRQVVAMEREVYAGRMAYESTR
jgi:hypothetical protein